MKKIIKILFIFLFPLKAFSLSLDYLPDSEKKITRIDGFSEAKKNNIMTGVFYKSGNEYVFEKLKFIGEYSDFSDSCQIRASVFGYRNENDFVFLNSLPLVSAKEFEHILYSLNYKYASSISLIFEFSKECKKSESSPDVIVIRQD